MTPPVTMAVPFKSVSSSVGPGALLMKFVIGFIPTRKVNSNDAFVVRILVWTLVTVPFGYSVRKVVIEVKLTTSYVEL